MSTNGPRYVAALRQAIDFTRSLQATERTGFDPIARMVTDEFAEIIREWARLNICSRPDEKIAGMCMEITHSLLEFLRGAGIDAIYTLGWMSYKNQAIYRFGPEDVRRWIKHGIPDRQRVDVHAWLTLPSAEILDPSWLSTVGIVQNKRDLIGAVIIADARQGTTHQYHPVAVDPEILFRVTIAHPNGERDYARQAPPTQNILELVL